MSVRDHIHTIVLEHTPLRDRSRRKRLVHTRRRLAEAVGSKRYSMPAAAGIDAKLQQYLPATGVFLEAGANDGYTWSNTYYLERWRNWSGVLVEGIPTLASECQRLRRRSQVYNYALVPSDFTGSHVTMTYSDLRSLISGSEPEMEKEVAALSETTYDVQVPARTLDAVLAEAAIEHLDFISLDLEGFEASALRGLDLERHRPEWLLIEVVGGEGRDGVESVLGAGYVAVAELTPADILYRRRAG